MNAVMLNIQALGSAAQKVPGYSGPTLGAKVADANVREFTAEQVSSPGFATRVTARRRGESNAEGWGGSNARGRLVRADVPGHVPSTFP